MFYNRVSFDVGLRAPVEQSTTLKWYEPWDILNASTTKGPHEKLKEGSMVSIK